jgi:hypothetical protein
MSRDLEKERLSTLASRLARATSSRGARWELREPELFQWSSGDGSVSVASRDRDGEPPYELTVYNAAQESVDRLASELLDGDEPAPWNAALAELHRVARRSALRADEIIDALIDALPRGDGQSAEERSFLRFPRRIAPVPEETP